MERFVYCIDREKACQEQVPDDGVKPKHVVL
jgi:hypothetical protein